MLRRVHTPRLTVGEIALDQTASRHARDVLRLTEGTEVEVFDDTGNVALGSIIRLSPNVIVRVEAINKAPERQFSLTVASAVPKGDRADWMIEKLSELGCDTFVPLAASRSVVLPEGKNKGERWVRIATEAAKQSRRRGVMRIDELTKLDALLSAAGPMFYLSTEPEALPITVALALPLPERLSVLIGPEGGWSSEEIRRFSAANVTGVHLTNTILRVETAAVAAAAVVMTLAAQTRPSNQGDQP